MAKEETDKYRNQKFQEVIFNLNQPYLKSGIQSAYTNFSILDISHITSFFKNEYYPDGSKITSHLYGILQFQQDFLDYVGKLRREKWYTFPVISASLIFKDGEYLDENTAKMVVRHNWEYGFNDVNIMNVEEVTSIASCCFEGSQKILIKSSSNGVMLKSFKDFENMPYNDNKENLKIFHNGSWRRGKLVKLPKRDLYKVTTVNNKELLVTDNHLNPTLNGNIETLNLSTDDYILFNTLKLHLVPENDLGLTYEQGILIGAYLGDGNGKYNKEDEMTSVNYSFSLEKKKKLLPIIKIAIEQIGVKETIRKYSPTNNNYPIVINSKKLCGFIQDWVTGRYAHEKSLNLDCLLQSIEFREGILDGLYATDGGNSNRIYSTSDQLIEDIEILITSLGKVSIIDTSNRMDEPVIIRGEYFKRNYPVHCIRWYSPKLIRNMKNVYKFFNNSIYFKIKSIEPYNNDDSDVYCFEMKDEPYFTLPNGIITHNCRLISDKRELKNKIFNSIGGSDISVGSTKVVTLNLARLALLSNNENEFIELVVDKTKLIHKYHFAHRNTLKKLIDKGLLPLYSYNIMSMDDQFATIGINGMYEAIKLLGGISKDEQGYHYNEKGFKIAKDMFNTIINLNKTTIDKYNYVSNIEVSPAESAAIKLNKKDRMYFGNKFINDKLGGNCYIYGNQWIPLKENSSIWHRINAAKLDNYCGGGAILHINLGENFNTFEDAWEFTKGLANKGVKYFSYISLISICENDHSFFGDICPICNEKVVTKGIKIVGYLVKMNSFSSDRKKELEERKFYNIK